MNRNQIIPTTTAGKNKTKTKTKTKTKKKKPNLCDVVVGEIEGNQCLVGKDLSGDFLETCM